MTRQSKGMAAKTTSVSLKLSQQDLLDLDKIASDLRLTRTAFMREAFQEKVCRVRTADTIDESIAAAVSRLENIVLQTKTHEEILVRLGKLEGTVMNKESFDKSNQLILGAIKRFAEGLVSLSKNNNDKFQRLEKTLFTMNQVLKMTNIQYKNASNAIENQPQVHG